jgi:hypothetical protein
MKPNEELRVVGKQIWTSWEDKSGAGNYAIAACYTEEYAKRIVDCFNALEGIHNPKEFRDTAFKYSSELGIQDAKIDQLRARVAELEQSLKESLSMMEQTMQYREMNGLTGGNTFLSCTIEKAKSLLK